MADVFISYSRHDGNFVRELHAFLTGAGRDVWVDWEDIPPASPWEQDIDDSIDAADSFVFVVTAQSLGSEYCLAELRHAQERGKRIVPLACDGADPAAAPEGLRQLNWIWCREADDRTAAFVSLTRALDTDLEWSKAHTRLLVRAVDWDARHDGSLLLRGRDLEEAARQLALNAGKEPAPTELQQRYLHESRRAASRRQRILLGSVSLALAVSIALGVAALLQRNDARSATRKATSVALASTANVRLESKPDQALLLALAAYELSPSAQARNAVFMSLEAARELGVAEFLHGDSEVRSIAFAPDGRTLAVGSAAGAVRLWDVPARRALARPAARAGPPIVSVGFAHGAATVLAAGADGTLRLLDDRSQVARALRAPRAILAAAVSRDARTAAAIDGAGHLWLWDVQSSRKRRLAGPKGDFAMLAFSPDGRTLAAGVTDTADVEEGAPGTVRLVDVASGRFADLPGDDSVDALAFTPNGRRLAVAAYANASASKYGNSSATYGEVVLWDVSQRTAVGLLENRSRVDTVAVAPDGRTVVAGLADGTIREGVPEEGKWVGSPLRGLRGGVSVLAFSRDGHTIAAAAPGDTAVRVWDLHNPVSLGRPIAKKEVIGGVAFSPDGGTVAAADAYDGVLLVRPGAPARRAPTQLNVPASDASVDEVAFSGDGDTLAASSDDGSIQLWNLRRSRPSGRLPPRGDAPGPQELALDRVGRVLAAWGDDGKVRLWNVPRHRLLDGQPDARDVVAAAFLDGGRTLVTAAADGGVELWDVALSKRRGPPLQPLQQLSAATFSPDARTVAFADGEGRVWLWDLRSRAPAAELAGGARTFPSLALSADGRTLAMGPENGDVQVWDTRARVPLGQPLPHTSYARFVFSPDGRSLLSAGGGPIRLWEGILWRDLADLQAQVCRLVIGDLTRAEWAAIAPGMGYRRTCNS